MVKIFLFLFSSCIQRLDDNTITQIGSNRGEIVLVFPYQIMITTHSKSTLSRNSMNRIDHTNSHLHFKDNGNCVLDEHVDLLH